MYGREKLLDWKFRRRAQWMPRAAAELQRSFALSGGYAPLDLGAMSGFLSSFREREDLPEFMNGQAASAMRPLTSGLADWRHRSSARVR